MKKNWIIYVIITIIIGLTIGVGTAFYFSNKDKTQQMDILSEKELAQIDNNVYNDKNENFINSLETAAINEQISPNAILIKKVYYEACDHLIRKSEDVPEAIVNKTEEDLKNIYGDWKIEDFSPTQIILYKNDKGNCGEHYFIQEHNGVIRIYTTDQYGVKSIKKDTEISTQYLPDEDIQRLKAGVEVIGNTNLIEFLEDYE